jgi:hypothetical protein
MKKTILAFSAITVLSVLGASCEKAKDVLFPSFETDGGTVELSIPVISSTAAEATLGSTTVHFDLDSAIKANTAGQFSINNAESIKLKNVILSVLNGDDESNISNFETAKVTLSSNSKSTPAVIATANLLDVDQPNVINGNGIELKEYLKGDMLTYMVAGKARRATKKALDLRISFTLDVK